jgi:hypothetical protein
MHASLLEFSFPSRSFKKLQIPTCTLLDLALLILNRTHGLACMNFIGVNLKYVIFPPVVTALALRRENLSPHCMNTKAENNEMFAKKATAKSCIQAAISQVAVVAVEPLERYLGCGVAVE